MSKPPLIRAVKAKAPTRLEIAWSTGEKSTADVSRLIKRFKLYAPLRNPALFGRAKADPWGHAYLYRSPVANLPPYEISSYGSDGREGGTGTAADISSVEH